MGRHDSREWIKWLIRFANLDMAGLRVRELRKEIKAMWQHIGATEETWSSEQVTDYEKSLLATDPDEIRPGMLRAQEIARRILTALADSDRGTTNDKPRGREMLYFKAAYTVMAWPPSSPREFFMFPHTYWSLVVGESGLGRSEEFRVTFSAGLVNHDFYQTIGEFLLIHLPHLAPTSIFQCSECRRFEFTNRGKTKPRCTRCLTKARVEKWRESEREKHNKARW